MFNLFLTPVISLTFLGSISHSLPPSLTLLFFTLIFPQCWQTTAPTTLRVLEAPCVTSTPSSPSPKPPALVSKKEQREPTVERIKVSKCNLITEMLSALMSSDHNYNDTRTLWSIACRGTVLTSNIRLHSQRAQLRFNKREVKVKATKSTVKKSKWCFDSEYFFLFRGLGGGGYLYLLPQKQSEQKGVIRKLAYDAERLPGKAEPSLPSSVATAASRRPDTDDVFQPKHDDHHKLLFKNTQKTIVALPGCPW